MKLVKLDDVLELIDGSMADLESNYENSKLQEEIKRLPTVDIVRHGHWIERSKVYPDFPYDSTYNYECSNCGYMDTHGADVEVPYCWHCGAKMDEVTE